MEILDSIETEPITIYHIANKWWDLCAGPHVQSTGSISYIISINYISIIRGLTVGEIDPKAIQLQSVAGAYWRGDENRPMLQRIYGTAWENEQQLKIYNQR